MDALNKNNDHKIEVKELLTEQFWVIYLIFMFLLLVICFSLSNYVNTTQITSTVIATFMVVLIGLPMALAGSVVALVLSERAYETMSLDAKVQRVKEINEITIAASESYLRVIETLRELKTCYARISTFLNEQDIVKQLNNKALSSLSLYNTNSLDAGGSFKEKLRLLDEGYTQSLKSNTVLKYRFEVERELNEIRSGIYNYGFGRPLTLLDPHELMLRSQIDLDDATIDNYFESLNFYVDDLRDTVSRLGQAMIDLDRNYLSYQISKNTSDPDHTDAIKIGERLLDIASTITTKTVISTHEIVQSLKSNTKPHGKRHRNKTSNPKPESEPIDFDLCGLGLMLEYKVADDEALINNGLIVLRDIYYFFPDKSDIESFAGFPDEGVNLEQDELDYIKEYFMNTDFHSLLPDWLNKIDKQKTYFNVIPLS